MRRTHVCLLTFKTRQRSRIEGLWPGCVGSCDCPCACPAPAKHRPWPLSLCSAATVGQGFGQGGIQLWGREPARTLHSHLDRLKAAVVGSHGPAGWQWFGPLPCWDCPSVQPRPHLEPTSSPCSSSSSFWDQDASARRKESTHLGGMG